MQLVPVMVGRAICYYEDGSVCEEYPIGIGWGIDKCWKCGTVPTIISKPPGAEYDVIEVPANDVRPSEVRRPR